jgi:F-type H+-transporting ATPase subunit a
MGILIAFAVVVRIKLKKFDERKPKGFQNVVELMVEMFDGFVKSSAGEKFRGIGSWFFMVFAFILISNISGLIFLGTLRPPTADWSVTFALAMSTFVIIQIMGIKHRKGNYLKSFLEPVVFFLPINLIGELARPVSLSFRLFGNVLGGMILITLLYQLPAYILVGIPTVLHAYFDLIAGLLQTYIFCVLSLSFIGEAAATE